MLHQPALTSPSVVARIMKEHGLSFRRSLGQNFLIDRHILEKMLSAAAIQPDECVIEIGSGMGTLTVAMAPLCRRFVAVEIDRSLVPLLEAHTAGFGNVTVVQGDATKMDFRAMLAKGCDCDRPRPWKVVSNLPYYVTSPIVTGLLFSGAAISRIVLMVQREVAQRMTAPPGSDDYGAFSVACQYKTRPEIYAPVPRTAFMPAPEVDSAIVVMDVRESPEYSVPDEGLFFRVVREAFNYRRKTISSALRSAFGRESVRDALAAAGIDPSRRGETLSLAEFAELSRCFLVKGSPGVAPPRLPE
ncbi:MAG: 16S rRNA (adenine(1518)-N(6)/adenine(1519)-N(6))-dimethyltransferase RsmA [Ignavibacteriales bacterium]